MKTQTALLTTALLASLMVPVAFAEPAPDPEPYETRILHDHGEDAAAVLADKHGHDLIALDAREEYDASYGENMLVLRLTMAGGCNAVLELTVPCPERTDTVHYSAGGEDHAWEFSTSDEASWSGNMDRYSAPEDLGDGRFAVEGAVRFSRFGGSAGDELSDWNVIGAAGDEDADKMSEGQFPNIPDLLEEAFDIGTYELRAPDYYASLDIEADEAEIASGAGVKTILSVEIENLVNASQDVQLDSFHFPGVSVKFVDPADDVEKVSITLSMAANESQEIDMVLRGASGAGPDGTLTLRILSSLGGVDYDTVDLKVDGADPTPTPIPSPTPTPVQDADDDQDDPIDDVIDDQDDQDDEPAAEEESKDSPGAGLALTALALVGVAIVAYRRRE